LGLYGIVCANCPNKATTPNLIPKDPIRSSHSPLHGLWHQCLVDGTNTPPAHSIIKNYLNIAKYALLKEYFELNF